MNEKFFIKDSALEKGNDMSFSYKDYVKRLKNIIIEHNAPFNIAIVGKWGVGKSSITNLLKEEFKGKDGYLVHEINAWKYESDSLRKAFLKQLWITLGGKPKDFWQNLKEYVVGKTEISEEDLTIWQSIKALIPTAISLLFLWLFFFVVSYGLYILAYWLMSILPPDVTLQSKDVIGNSTNAQISTISKFDWTQVTKKFIDNMWLPLLIPPIFAILQNINNALKGKKIISGFRITKPAETSDEYEELFKEQIKSYQLAHNLSKLIVIVDDLDRLSPRKVVDALDAIKAFVDVPECIFVVACDESILIKALEEQKPLKEQLGIDEERYLDKIFQFRVPLPPIIDSDMREFAINLVQKEAPDLYLSCNGLFEDLVNDILVHADVVTPRQVKKIINTFAGNLFIALLREKNQKLQTELLTNPEGIKILAKLSVIEADYNSFYRRLVADFGLIEEFIHHYNQNTAYTNLPLNIVEYFQKNNDGDSKLKPKWQGLVNFLFKTQHIRSENLSPYVYLAQDALGLQIGDERQRVIHKALLSGNEKGVLNSTEEIIKSIDASFIIRDVRNCLPKDLKNVLKASYQLISYMPDEERPNLSDAISTQIHNLNHEIRLGLRYWQIDISNIMSVFFYANNKNGAEISLLNVMDLCFEKDNKLYEQTSDEQFDELINKLLIGLFENNEKLTPSINHKIQSFISVKKAEYNSYSVYNLVCIFNQFPELYKEYFGEMFYDRLTSYMIDEAPDDEWEDLSLAFKYIFKIANGIEISRLIKPIAKIIKLDEALATYIIEVFETVTEHIPEDEGNFIGHELLATEFTQKQILHKSLKLCSSLRIKLQSEKEIESVNTVLISLLQKDDDELREVTTLLFTSIVKDNSIDQLERTLDYVFSQLLTTNILDGFIEKISDLMNDSQRQKLISQITPTISFNYNDHNASARSIRILEILMDNKKNHKIIKNLVENEINSFVNHWPQKPQYAKNLLEIIGITKRILDKPRLVQIETSLLNTGYQQNPDIMIYGFRNIGILISENNIVDVIKKVIEKGSNYGDILEVIEFLLEHKKNINNENNTLSLFVDFSINNLNRSPKEILNALNIMVGSLGKVNLKGFINAIINLDDDDFSKMKSSAIKTVNKLFGKNSKTIVIKEILSENKNPRTIEVLQELLKQDIVKKQEEILNEIIKEVTNEDPNDYKNALLNFCIEFRNIIASDMIAHLFIRLLRSGDDETVEMACETILNSFSDYTFKKSKSFVANELVQAFIDVNTSAKEKILLIAKQFKMESAFKSALSKGLFANDLDIDLVEKKFKRRNLTSGLSRNA